MNEKSGQDGQRHAPVQPLEPLPHHLTRTVDGTDRQNLADTAIAGVPFEPRSRGPQPQSTAVEGSPIAARPRRSVPPPAAAPAPGLPWGAIALAALGAGAVVAIVVFLALG